MVKKVLGLLLTVLIAGTVTACGKSESNEYVTGQKQVEETEETTETTNEASNNESDKGSKSNKSKVLVEDDLVKITYKETSIDEDDDVLDCMKVVFEVENKGESKLNLTVKNLATDGRMINSNVDTDLPAGEKTRVDMRLYKDEVSEFKNIEGNFYIRNVDENKQVANYDFELFEVDNYFSSRESSKVVLIDNELITVKLEKKLEAAKGEINAYQGPSVRLEIKNKTTEDISINPDDISVGGVAVKVNTYFTVPKESTIKENIEFGKDISTLANIQGKIKVSCKEDITKAGDFTFSIQ